MDSAGYINVLPTLLYFTLQKSILGAPCKSFPGAPNSKTLRNSVETSLFLYRCKRVMGPRVLAPRPYIASVLGPGPQIYLGPGGPK